MAEPHPRLDDTAVGERLGRIDRLLERVEGVPGPTTEAAMEAVQTLTEIYGEALARVVDLAGPELRDSLAGDELLAHLLVLHEVHPDPVERRVARALDRLGPALRERGAAVELAGVQGGTATVRLTVEGCGSTAGPVAEAVREAVLAVAPELSDVRQAPTGDADAGHRNTAFVPLDTLTVARRPPAAAAAAPAARESA